MNVPTSFPFVSAAMTVALIAMSVGAQSPSGQSRGVGRTLRVAADVHEVTPGAPIGRVDCILALPDGGVVVADGKGADGPSVYRFGPKGEFLARLGRVGGGPGEHGGTFPFGCLTLTPAGEVALHDAAGSRLVIWNLKQSTTRTITLPTRLAGPPPLVVWQPDGSVLAKVMMRRADPDQAFDPSAFSFLKINGTSEVQDTIGIPVPREFVKSGFGWYQPWNTTTVLPNGTSLMATTDATGFLLRDRSGKLWRIERRWPKLPISRAERQQAERFTQWDFQRSKGKVERQDIPSTKPAFTALQVAFDGLIWFRLSTLGKKGFERRLYSGAAAPNEPTETIREPWLFDVLTGDGTAIFLVDIQPVNGVPLMFATSGLTLWASVERPDGSPSLVRWR